MEVDLGASNTQRVVIYRKYTIVLSESLIFKGLTHRYFLEAGENGLSFSCAI